MIQEATTKAQTRRVRPRPAATLVLLREGAGGLEVLMGRRALKHRFMPGKMVFPGGRVDASDAAGPADGPPPEPGAAILRRRWGERRAFAPALAAIRETYEETGLLVGRAVSDTDMSVAPAPWAPFEAAGLTPAVSRLKLIARAITPASRPMRFDTWFFMARAEELDLGGTERPSAELEEVAWFPLATAHKEDCPRITEAMLAEINRRVRAPEDEPPMFVRTIKEKSVRVTLT
ncbi:MAG: NUDIX domain-containing protein [Maricaulaceae bacterium]